MLAYHNDPSIKDKYLARVQAHREADEIIKGKYWEGGKGCAVGCTVHSNNHKAYEQELGIPQMLARLEDVIFEGLPNVKAKAWPEHFLKAVNTGSDLSLVGYKFLYWNLTENLTLKDSDDKDVQKVIIQCRDAIKQCAEAICPLTKGEKVDINAARSAAECAAESAECAARSVARSMEERTARSAAECAAESAEYAARSAAWSAAWSAARSAAECAARSAAWSAAWSAARSTEYAAYEKMADKLIELIEEAA